MGRPWKGAVEHYNTISITAEVGKTKDWSDRCLHTVTKSEDPEQLLALNFDWQRTYNTGRPIKADVLNEGLKSAQAAATKYFEDLAEGSLFDEEIIRATT